MVTVRLPRQLVLIWMANMKFSDNIARMREAFKFAFRARYTEHIYSPKGHVTIHMTCTKTGKVLHHSEQDNLVMLDAGLLLARLCKDSSEPPFGINMLAVGTGATGAIFSPDAPTDVSRKLHNELARKSFSTVTFRDANGAAVAYPTNVVDFTATFGEAEAVGPWNEMGLMSTVSASEATQNLHADNYPTRTLATTVVGKDILLNRITFAPLSKPSQAQMTITWRLTF